MISYSPSEGCVRSTLIVCTLWHKTFSWCHSAFLLKLVLKNAFVWIFGGDTVYASIIAFRLPYVASIVVGGRVFDFAGGPSKMWILVYVHRVYKWYIRYVYSVNGGPPDTTKSQKCRPPTTMVVTVSRSDGPSLGGGFEDVVIPRQSWGQLFF